MSIKVLKFLALSFFSCLAVSSLAQKVKYKDLFVFLNNKQYDQAEPYLKKYLKDNDDNPNAFLFMGIIYQEKAEANDVLQQSEKLGVHCDSAVYFLERANREVDEKEVRKNEEYYQSYSRRDLRTGKFGVKLSDIQIDLEKRIKGTKERKDLVFILNKYYVSSEQLYQKCTQRFTEIQGKYSDQRELYLRSDDKLLNGLRALSLAYDSCLIAFNEYKVTSKKIGKTGYNQALDPREIKDFKKEGNTPADFSKDDLFVWDYKRWAGVTTEIIEKEIYPMRDILISYDMEINKLREKLKKDSVSVKPELKQLSEKLSQSTLRKYDPDPLPVDVFAIKLAELVYGSDVILNKPVKDSSNFFRQTMLIEDEIEALGDIDSLANQIMDHNFDQEAENYKHFVTNAYGTPSVLKSMVNTTRDFALREKGLKEEELKKVKLALNWILDASDSIPLKLEYRQKKHIPLVVAEEKFTSGIMHADTTASGYFYSITPQRNTDVKVTFPLRGSLFKKTNLPLIKGLATSDAKGQVFFSVIYSEEKKIDKYPVVVSKIYRTDGLSWSNTYWLDGTPSEISFSSESGELSLKISSAGGNKMVVIQKDGKKSE